MNDGLAFVVSVLCLGTVFGAPAFLVGNLSADKPVSAAHWAKAEALCATNEGGRRYPPTQRIRRYRTST